jgi:dihydroneopterin aldolase
MGDLKKAVYSDELTDTLNYGTIYELVKEEMMMPSKLLEHVAGRIGQRIIDTFPQVEMVVVTVTKENPPMGADLKGVSVTLVLSRDE